MKVEVPMKRAKDSAKRPNMSEFEDENDHACLRRRSDGVSNRSLIVHTPIHCFVRDRVIRVDVEFSAENIKDPSDAVAVQITMRSRGPVIRAEARAGDKNSAFDQAFDRLKSQLRKAADRRKTHQGLRLASALDTSQLSAPPTDASSDEDTYEVAGIVVNGDVVSRADIVGRAVAIAARVD